MSAAWGADPDPADPGPAAPRRHAAVKFPAPGRRARTLAQIAGTLAVLVLLIGVLATSRLQTWQALTIVASAWLWMIIGLRFWRSAEIWQDIAEIHQERAELWREYCYRLTGVPAAEDDHRPK